MCIVFSQYRFSMYILKTPLFSLLHKKYQFVFWPINPPHLPPLRVYVSVCVCSGDDTESKNLGASYAYCYWVVISLLFSVVRVGKYFQPPLNICVFDLQFRTFIGSNQQSKIYLNYIGDYPVSRKSSNKSVKFTISLQSFLPLKYICHQSWWSVIQYFLFSVHMIVLLTWGIVKFVFMCDSVLGFAFVILVQFKN